MASIINDSNMEFRKSEKELEEYSWISAKNISQLATTENLQFNVRILGQGQYSYPYHFHRHSEELFVILEGSGKLRTPEGIKDVVKGDIIFFEKGASGAHQLKNESTDQLKYLDIRTDLGMDVCEYPDSGKVNILPAFEIYEQKDKVDYFHGEKNVKDIW